MCPNDVRTYSDEYLEYFSDRYHAMRLSLHGISLDDFLAAPSRYKHLEHEHLPLMPKQAEVAKSIFFEQYEDLLKDKTTDQKETLTKI